MPRTLILVPTAMERQFVSPHLANCIADGDAIELCGFGPIAAAANTARWLAVNRPDRVILVGIAGAYGSQLKIGEALMFGRVSSYGIGVGSGEDHQSASQLGWCQFSEEDDRIKVDCGPRAPLELLTCCAASSNDLDVRLRLANHPDASAEDMEGYGVALACQLARVPCSIVRGISNYAGQRDKASWRIEQALESAAHVVIQRLAADTVDGEGE